VVISSPTSGEGWLICVPPVWPAVPTEKLIDSSIIEVALGFVIGPPTLLLRLFCQF
jgi:hypothetical protein